VKVNATAKNVNVTMDAISGFISVVKDIVHYAKVNNADMIVIGNRGMTGFKKLLIGSIASGVVTYSDRPVLVVK
jgi:nucleotide-binding universal stress UspA family protein